MPATIDLDSNVHFPLAIAAEIVMMDCVDDDRPRHDSVR